MSVRTLLKTFVTLAAVVGLSQAAHGSCNFKADSLFYGHCQKRVDAVQTNLNPVDCVGKSTDSIQFGKCFTKRDQMTANEDQQKMRFDSTNCQRGGCEGAKTWAH